MFCQLLKIIFSKQKSKVAITGINYQLMSYHNKVQFSNMFFQKAVQGMLEGFCFQKPMIGALHAASYLHVHMRPSYLASTNRG